MSPKENRMKTLTLTAAALALLGSASIASAPAWAPGWAAWWEPWWGSTWQIAL